jgi:hypothetical protein
MKTSIHYQMLGFSTMRKSHGVLADANRNPLFFVSIGRRVGNKRRRRSTPEVSDQQRRHLLPWVAFLELSTAWANHGIQCIPPWNRAAK